MTGRGVDQILPFSCPPAIHEPVMTSAEGYVALAERESGPIPEEVGWDYVWGDALDGVGEAGPDLRILNLETAVTLSEEALPKGINYRMHPSNVPVLEAFGADACVLANNHVLDWGEPGLIETVETLEDAGLPAPGAGRSLAEAAAPVRLETDGGPDVLLFAVGAVDAGVPPAQAAASTRPGVAHLRDHSERTAHRLAERIRVESRESDVVVLSIHQGSNWGWEVPEAHRRFARTLIEEAGVDVVHGHSSHHPRPAEIHGGRAVLHGAGDFVNDYEGIGGRERFRSELVVAWLLTLDAETHRTVRVEMLPFRIRRFRLQRTTDEETDWLRAALDRATRPLGHAVGREGERLLLEI